MIFPEQFIDFTKSRINSFYNEINEVKHQEMGEPFLKELRKILFETSKELNFSSHESGTLIVIGGPRFSTKAESIFFKKIADIIGMTTSPECQLVMVGTNYLSGLCFHY